MQLLRYIAFVLPVMVMMGHDIVPHVHESDYAVTADHVIIPSSVTPSSEASLSILLRAFEHNSNAGSLLYTIGQEQQTDFQLDIALPGTMMLAPAAIEWYTNLKKQRFWDNTSFALQGVFRSYSHRGPPVA